MDASSFEFERNSGPFKGRQHIVNHIDMILGLGRDFYSSFRKGRILHMVIPGQGPDCLTPISTLSDEQLQEHRGRLLHQSIFAKEWQQLLPIREKEHLGPLDFHSLEDGKKVLRACEREWIDKDCGGSEESFWEETSAVVLLAFWDYATCDRILVRDRPAVSESEIPAPINGRAVMSVKHGYSPEWHTFADRICQEDHVKGELISRQGGICPICGRVIGKRAVVHHVDYDHECGLAHIDKSWRKPGTRVRPDCQRCHREHSSLFEECIARLRAVHSDCNYLIEGLL